MRLSVDFSSIVFFSLFLFRRCGFGYQRKAAYFALGYNWSAKHKIEKSVRNRIWCLFIENHSLPNTKNIFSQFFLFADNKKKILLYCINEIALNICDRQKVFQLNEKKLKSIKMQSRSYDFVANYVRHYRLSVPKQLRLAEKSERLWYWRDT